MRIQITLYCSNCQNTKIKKETAKNRPKSRIISPKLRIRERNQHKHPYQTSTPQEILSPLCS
jgi:formate-dependent nitrite reductase cytochrome c552 subunit